jgi:putative glycosyltransferase (TIGR04348 family)
VRAVRIRSLQTSGDRFHFPFSICDRSLIDRWSPDDKWKMENGNGSSANNMRIGIITPAPPKSRYGNRVTALRWAGILRKLGHSVTVKQACGGERFELLIGLHALRSHVSIARFHREHPDIPIVVALTGTDLYRDLQRSKRAQQSLELATRIVVLQPKALEALRQRWREKTRVIYQSVKDITKSARRDPDARSISSIRGTFDVCVIGHLRPVKDPFRAAMAARLLPGWSRIRVVQVGRAMTAQQERRARGEMNTNPRYQWLGEQPPARVRRIVKQSKLCVLSSRLEGGANALGEAIVAGIPVLASRIPGSVGILGDDYLGYFETGATAGLAELMSRVETDPVFRDELRQACNLLVPLFDPAREEAAWLELLDELFEMTCVTDDSQDSRRAR